MDLDVVVVATVHRKALILEYLKEISHKLCYTKDYDLPVGFTPEAIGLVQNHTGAYRCFRGHQDAIQLCSKENILVLEDDAVPNINKWYEIVLESVHLLDKFEIVSLHGRDIVRESYEVYEEIKPGGNFLYIPGKKRSPVHGSLAYLINRRSFDRLSERIYDGVPMDFFIANYFSFCLIEKSPFNHDRSQGSLIDV